MPGLDVVDLSLIIAVIAATIAHPGSSKLSDVNALLQLAAGVSVRAAHIFFVLLVSISINSYIC